MTFLENNTVATTAHPMKNNPALQPAEMQNSSVRDNYYYSLQRPKDEETSSFF